MWQGVPGQLNSVLLGLRGPKGASRTHHTLGIRCEKWSKLGGLQYPLRLLAGQIPGIETKAFVERAFVIRILHAGRKAQ